MHDLSFFSRKHHAEIEGTCNSWEKLALVEMAEKFSAGSHYSFSDCSGNLSENISNFCKPLYTKH